MIEAGVLIDSYAEGLLGIEDLYLQGFLSFAEAAELRRQPAGGVAWLLKLGASHDDGDRGLHV